MTIEENKFYKTRSGQIVRVISGPRWLMSGSRCIVGWWEGKRYHTRYLKWNGKWEHEEESPHDLIEEVIPAENKNEK